MPKGGRRAGAGRKKAQHTIETEAMRAFLVETVRKNLEPLLKANLDLALGHDVMFARAWEKDGKGRLHRTGKFYRVTDPGEMEELLNGSGAGDEYFRIHAKSPEGNAIQYLLNQSIGKPVERTEHSGKDGQPIPVSFDLTKASADELLKFLTTASADSFRVHG